MTPEPAEPFAGIPAHARILVAFSGGIDSALSAKICLEAGFSVLPVYLVLDPDCPPEKTVRARAVADALGLSLSVLDCRAEFRERVMLPCWRVFSSGRTPNPCVLCNPLFKFGKLLAFAEENGCAAVATGHYARVNREIPALFRGADPAKDQSYFLCGLSSAQIRRCCFPLGSMRKSEVRERVRALGLPNASAPESQDVCFVPPGTSAGEFLRGFFHADARCGDFVDPDGRILGRHPGIHTFTPGQRKGTGVALGRPAYVRRVDPETARIELTVDEADLMSSRFTVSDIARLDLPDGPDRFRAEVQIRYRGRPVSAEVRLTGNGTAEVVSDRPLRAVTPGQAAVFYDGIRQIGGGVIGLETEE